MTLESNTKQLALLRDIYEVSNSCFTKTYIWGGFVPDILTGEFLREHKDIDGFTLNLWEYENELAAMYKERGYTISRIQDVDFLRIDQEDVHAVFNQLEVNGETALWRHAGREGTVHFPKQWLSNTPQDFCGTKAYISGIEFEYAIKTYPQLLHPEWNRRDKDIATAKWLERAIDERGLHRETILKQIWSYNPYWTKKGFKQYQMPCVAWKLEPPERGNISEVGEG